MLIFSLYINILILLTVFIASVNVYGSQPVMQKTIEMLFKDRSRIEIPEPCKFFVTSSRQSKICNREPGLPDVLLVAKEQALNACQETFRYNRWNCTHVYNRKPRRSIFKKIYRETAFVYALMAASISHAVAMGCASGDLSKCTCKANVQRFSSTKWKDHGCDDDLKYGKRITKNFLDYKYAGTDQIAEILKHDITIGFKLISEQMKEVCRCHGFSGSCTTKTCWRRLRPFISIMASLKNHYHHAVKMEIVNYTTKRAISPNKRKKITSERKFLLYLEKSPNLCIKTTGRVCKDKDNCATLCCGRGYVISQSTVIKSCKCKMINCCYVKCDTCSDQVNNYVCK